MIDSDQETEAQIARREMESRLEAKNKKRKHPIYRRVQEE